MSEGGGSGGASNCATGAEGVGSYSEGVVQPECQGYAKPGFQSGASLTGGTAVYGQPSDGVRDIPDVSMFASNGEWGHFQTVCWNDPSYTSDGSAVCTGAPSTWSGFGGTSVASPTLAGIQALVNQKTGQNWGIGALTNYYQMGQNEYGSAGGTFSGASCNASGAGGPANTCVFNDVTQGDIAQACQGNSSYAQCYDWNTANRTNWGVTSTDVVTAATVIWGGSGYTTAPTCAIAGPSNNNPYKAPSGATLWSGGTQATCTASVSAASTTAKWTVAFEYSGADVAGMVLIISGPTGASPKSYTMPSCSSTTVCATDLVSGFSGNSWATCTSSTKTVTCTATTTGAAGNFVIGYGTSGGVEFDAELVEITNTTKGQGPNYVSAINITAGGSGYQPDTPITLGGPGSGAIAVANTSIATAASTYQPAYGAAPGWDMATGLGSVNANNMVNNCVWTNTCIQPQTITVTQAPPASAAYNSTFNVAATASSSLPVAITTSGSCSGSGTSSATITMTSGSGTCSTIFNQAGNGSYSAAPTITDNDERYHWPARRSLSSPAPPASAAYGSNFNLAAKLLGPGCSDHQFGIVLRQRQRQRHYHHDQRDRHLLGVL